jgi:hypothetical protein
VDAKRIKSNLFRLAVVRVEEKGSSLARELFNLAPVPFHNDVIS